MFPFETETVFDNSTQDKTPAFWSSDNQEIQVNESIVDEELANNPNMLTFDVLEEVGGNTEPFFRTKMLQTIDAVEEYSWSRGEMGGLDWGFDSLNKAFEGLNTGVHLIGGSSNIGKSSFMMQIAWQVAKCNRHTTKEKPRKAFVLFFSLDDNNNELLPRLIAIDQRIPINVVRFPKKYQDNATYMEKRAEGLQALRDSVDHINMMDVNCGSDIEYIEKTMEEYHVELQKIDPAYQLVVFIDNFHDITIGDEKLRNKTGGEKYDHIADQLTKICTRYDTPMICTAEFRKLNGNRRPTVEDLRDLNNRVTKNWVNCWNPLRAFLLQHKDERSLSVNV